MPNVNPNELHPNDINEGPDVLDERLGPQERGATTPGEGLPLTGADLTLIVLLGGTTIAIGVVLVKSRRHPDELL